MLAVGLAVSGPAPAQAAFATGYQLPCQPYGSPYYAFGQYVSGWGYHTGEDVCQGGGAGTPVYATANGRVVYSARTPDSYRWGNLVLIEHTNGDGTTVVSLYGHMGNNRQVAAGQAVVKGQLIGFIGPGWTLENGNWGAHIHFSIRAGGYGAATGTYAPWVRGYESNGTGGWARPSDYVNARLAAYDYVQMSGTGGGPLNYNASYTVNFKVRNTGSATWRAGGANPVRLGTIGPKDRPDGFSQFGTNPGWVGSNRISLQADTGPGGTATFSAKFTSNRVPGVYNDCFGVLLEGQAWMSGPPVCVVVHVLPPSYRAEYVTQMITKDSSPTDLSNQTSGAYLLPGQKISLKFMLRNSGELNWEADGPNPIRLGTANPLDRPSIFATGGDYGIPTSENWPGYNRPSDLDGKYDPVTKTVSPADTIVPGEVGIFSFTATVPDRPGTYNEYFQPLVEGVSWMPPGGMYLPLRVMAPGYHYDPASQNFSTRSAGLSTSSVDAVLQIRNSGRTPWPVNGDFRLGTDGPMDHASPFYTGSGTGAWLAPNRLSAIDRNATSPGKTTVDPGEAAEFSMKLTVPPWPVGSYQLKVRPVMDGVTWLPENYGTNFTVNITVPPHNYEYVKQTFSQNPATVVRNSILTTSLALKNTGRAAWQVNGPNAVRLGTSRPQDRSSALAVTGGADPWLALNRASGIDGRVTDTTSLATVAATQINPGETALFKVPLNTSNLGSYTEYFTPLVEGVTWMQDIGIFFPITIRDGTIQPSPPPSPSPSPAPSPTPGNSVTLNPAADTYVRHSSPTTNYASSSPLNVDGGTNVERSFLKFDLSNLAGKTITSAKLRFYVTNQSVDTQSIKSVSDTSWSETLMTANNQPARGATVATINATTANAWKEVDITSATASKAGELLSLAIDQSGSDGMDFTSKEGTNKPQLVITTSSPSPSPTPAVITATPEVSPSPSILPTVKEWFSKGDEFTACEVIGSTTPCTKNDVDRQVSSAWNYKVTYTTSNLEAGTYKLNLNYQNVNGAVPPGYAYNVVLWLEDGTAIPVALDGASSTFTIPNVPLSGISTFSLEWTNDYYLENQYDANWAINTLSITP